MRTDGPYPFTEVHASLADCTVALNQNAIAPEPNQLVAGKVDEIVSFDHVQPSDLQPLQLYSRAADRIEAATRIATGLQLDIEL